MVETFPHEPVILPVRSFGRQLRSLAGYAVLTALMLVSPLLVFVPTALFHCGLRNGRRWAWATLALATLLASLLYLPSAQSHAATATDVKSVYAFLAALVLAIGVPSLLSLPMVERGAPFGRIVMFALLTGMAGLGLTELGMRLFMGFSPYHEQVVLAGQTSQQFVEVYQKAGMPPDTITVFQRWLGFGVFCLPAFILMYVIVIFVLSLVMLSRLKVWRDHAATRPEPDTATVYYFRNLSLPEWLLFAFVVGGITPLTSGLLQEITANMLAVVAFLYFMQGLAIFRSMLATAGAGFFGAVMGCVLLGVLTLFGIGPLLLSIGGLFDSFFDFRHFKRKDDSHESHID